VCVSLCAVRDVLTAQTESQRCFNESHKKKKKQSEPFLFCFSLLSDEIADLVTKEKKRSHNAKAGGGI
jgi:hypothetical protein